MLCPDSANRTRTSFSSLRFPGDITVTRFLSGSLPQTSEPSILLPGSYPELKHCPRPQASDWAWSLEDRLLEPASCLDFEAPPARCLSLLGSNCLFKTLPLGSYGLPSLLPWPTALLSHREDYHKLQLPTGLDFLRQPLQFPLFPKWRFLPQWVRAMPHPKPFLSCLTIMWYGHGFTEFRCSGNILWI